MSITTKSIQGDFGIEIDGLDANSDLSEAEKAMLLKAFHDHSIVVLRNVFMEDESQVRFSQIFGEVEVSLGANPSSGTKFSRQSNIDIASGGLIPPDDRRMAYQKGNYLWHMDSSFKQRSSLCSILSAREVPPEGGNTEFCSTRLLYESLSPAEQAELDTLTIEHDIRYSRGLTGFKYTEAEAKNFQTAPHKLVRTNRQNGRKSLLIGIHAWRIAGWDDERSRNLIDSLNDRAEALGVYSHQWLPGDVVIWDNQAALHRATAYDTVKYRRLMQRTTIAL
jgi:alpha-ketoglutarate-dependent 2,4-dichlorophenoxyacetate dioxygenase